MLTIPKIKDLVNKPITQYNEITSSDEKHKHEKKGEQKQDMENELQNFLKDLKNPDISTTNVISSNEIIQNPFSSY